MPMTGKARADRARSPGANSSTARPRHRRGGSRVRKPAAVLSARPLCEVGAVFSADPALLLREFVCPGCGALLDSEIALPDDPYLDDRLAR